MTLDFGFGDDELAVREAVGGLLESAGGLVLVRSVEADGRGVSRSLWKQLGALGFLGLAVPEASGGGGAPLSVALQASRAAGRALAPIPLELGGFVAAHLVAGDRRVMTEVLEGRLLPTLRLGELVIGGSPSVTIVKGRASGITSPVPFAAEADLLFQVVGKEVAIIDVSKEVPSCTIPDMAARGMGRYSLKDASVIEVVPKPDRSVLEAGQILFAGRAVGGAEACLDLAVDYARERRQFDRPIGSFQAIQHRLANTATAVHMAGLVVERAATRVQGSTVSASALATTSWSIASTAFLEAARTVVQVFGGYGFTLEYDPQLFYRHAKSLGVEFGPERGIEARHARELGVGFDDASL